jgi:hypothetical protein
MNAAMNCGPRSEMTTLGVPWCFQTSFRKRRAVPSALMVVCIGMKCVRMVRLLTTHIIASYLGSWTMKSMLIVSHGASGVSEGWSSPIGH